MSVPPSPIEEAAAAGSFLSSGIWASLCSGCRPPSYHVTVIVLSAQNLVPGENEADGFSEEARSLRGRPRFSRGWKAAT
jgi:hypothetical protein